MTSPQSQEDGLDFVDENEEWAKIEKVMASLDTGLSSGDVIIMEDEERLRDILEGGGMPRGSPRKTSVTNSDRVLFTNDGFSAYDRALTEWLTRHQLSDYEHLLISNGFDNLKFMGADVMTESDLIEAGMIDAQDRCRLLRAAEQLPDVDAGRRQSVHDSSPQPLQQRQAPPPSSVSSSSLSSSSAGFSSVEDWLASLDLRDYSETFAAHGCRDLRDLLNIWDLQLTSVFHISRLGHRNRIMASINSLRTSVQRTNSKTSKTEPTKHGATNGCQGNEAPSKAAAAAAPVQNICLTEYLLHRHNNLNNNSYNSSSNHNNNNSNGPAGDVSLFKDYSSLRSNKSGRSSAAGSLKRQSEEDQDQGRRSRVITLEEVLRNCGVLEPAITVMTPSTSSASSSSSKTAVNTVVPPPPCASPEVKQSDAIVTGNSSNLQHGHSNFSVTYLGSVKLPSIEKPDLARKCIEQIRLSPVEDRKVVISISYKQVTFRDLSSQEIMGAHDISNIFCVCQDSELLEYFAFVTWDAVESVHFCHVFNAQYLKLSTDVVLALGKAFEVAFQLIQQEASKQNGRSPQSSASSPASPPSSSSAPMRPQATASERRSTFV